MATKVEIEYTNVVYDANGEPIDKIGQRAKVEPEEAERLVTGGAAVFATKSDASAAGAPDAPTTRSK